MLTISTILFESTSKNKRFFLVLAYSVKKYPRGREKVYDLSQKNSQV